MCYTKRLLSAVLRQNFSSFIIKVFHTINPGNEFITNWHVDLLSDYLESIRLGRIKRLIINIPPRSLKSLCVNVAWPAWLLGINPCLKIISTSYSNALSIKHSLDCRMIIQSQWYKNLFPNTIISKENNQKHKFLTTENGFRLATSTGGTLTGEGADVLIVDDPHNPIHINSVKLRNKVIEWFEGSFMTRLNNKRTGSIVIIMQRLHNDDLSGYLNIKDGWEIVKIPSIANKDVFFTINNNKYIFKEGEILNSKLDTIESLLKLENAIGKKNYHAQYLQSPIDKSYNLISESELSLYTEIPNLPSYFVLSIDSAIKLSTNSDYTVCTCWKIIKNKYYLIDLIRDKMDYPLLKESIKHQIQKYNPKYTLIEDKSSGQSLIQDLISEGIPNIKAIKATKDKITRFSSVLYIFHSNRVFFPKNSKFNRALIREITQFPTSRNDDIVDSISQFLNFIRKLEKKNSTPKMRTLQ